MYNVRVVGISFCTIMAHLTYILPMLDMMGGNCDCDCEDITVPIKTHHKKLGVYVKDGACLECVWTVDCTFVLGGGGGYAHS